MITKLDSKKVNELLNKYEIEEEWDYRKFIAYLKKYNLYDVDPELIAIALGLGHKNNIRFAHRGAVPINRDNYEKARQELESKYVDILKKYGLFHLKKEFQFICKLTVHNYYFFLDAEILIKDLKGVREEYSLYKFLEKYRKGGERNDIELTQIVFKTNTNEMFVVRDKDLVNTIIGKLFDEIFDKHLRINPGYYAPFAAPL